MSLTSLAKLFGLFSLLVHLSVALPQASTCSCNGNISQKGSGECKTTHEEKPFCYVNQGQCQDEQESSQSGWFWSYRACGQGTRSTPQEPDLRSRASTCSCNGNISQKGSGECKTTHEDQPFCYVNQGQCPDQQESSQSGWFWSKQACASASSCSCNGNLNDRGGGECQGDDDGQPYCYVNQGQCPDQQESSQSGWFWSEQACVQGTKSTVQKTDLFSGASTCSCNGNISSKGSGECKTTHEGQLFCYVNQGLCPDEQESSQSGWFWSKQACASASSCSCNGNLNDNGGGECRGDDDGQPYCYVNQGQCPDQQKSSKSGWFWSEQACVQGTKSNVQKPFLLPGASTCSCNGNISPKGSGVCKTNHEEKPFCYVNQGQCPDEQESSQSGWFWSKQACAPRTRSILEGPKLRSGASTCSCNGNISQKGSGECKTTHEEKSFCYVDQGQCPDEQESSQSGWFWSKQACAPRIGSSLTRSGSGGKGYQGYCMDSKGKDQNSGQEPLKNTGSFAECLALCTPLSGVTGCEWHTSGRCYYFTTDVASGSKHAGFTCWVKGSKFLTSPNYPKSYSNNQDTSQTMSVPAGSSILVKFLDFQIENHKVDCRWDYVQICDGNGKCGPKICGSSLPEEITIETSTATVKFHSDGSVTQKGFKLFYKALPGSLKYLTSPKFPNAYPNNQDTTQTMSVPAGSSIVVKFLDFQIENHRNCRWDYVQICDGNGKCGPKICGSSLPGEITIETSTATVKFHSDGSVTQKGFKLSYEPALSTNTNCQCGVKNMDQNRIVGGQEAGKNEYPWQVALTFCSDSSDLLYCFCGGTILTSKHILTAAHCTQGRTASSITVKVGEHDIRDPNDGQETVSVSSIKDHPDYDPDSYNYDMSILTLSEHVTFRAEVKPACLPNPSSNYDDITATVTGWGFLRENANFTQSKLHEVDIRTMSNSKCTGLYKPRKITDNMICAASPDKDSCQNDSGGPLMAPENGGQYYSLIGVVSWGHGCARKNSPGVYARVTDQLDWIQDNIEGGRTCSSP